MCVVILVSPNAEIAFTQSHLRHYDQACTGAQAGAQARELYTSIASVQGFYEQLALEQLGRSITVH